VKYYFRSVPVYTFLRCLYLSFIKPFERNDDLNFSCSHHRYGQGERGGGGHPKIFKKLGHKNAANTKIGTSLDFPTIPIPPSEEFAKKHQWPSYLEFQLLCNNRCHQRFTWFLSEVLVLCSDGKMKFSTWFYHLK
jgi:hypothetical protein